MKISAAPFSFTETASNAVSGKAAAGYGDVFESAIRSAEAAPPAPRAVREDAAQNDDAAGDKPIDDGSSGSPARDARAGRTLSSADNDAPKTSDPQDPKDAAPDAADTDAGAPTPTLTLLDRLFGGLATANAQAAPSPADGEAGQQEGETVLEERVVVVSLQPGATEEDLEAPRGKVTLEVLRMETHFEPRSEAVVLVEGGTSASKVAGAALLEAASPAELVARKQDLAMAGADMDNGDSATPAPGAASGAAPVEPDAPMRLRFDEALARLGTSPTLFDPATGSSPSLEAMQKAAQGGDAAGTVEKADRADKLERTALPVTSGDAATGETATDDRGASDEQMGARRSNARSLDRAQAGEVDDKAARRFAVASQTTRIDDSSRDGVLPLASMTDQVAGRIIDTLGSAPTSARSSERTSGDAYLRFTAGGAALKTLTIQLQPENLGVLDVSMRLIDGQLTLELAASEASTAKVLAEDREGLRKLLQHAGFSMDEASITIVTRDPSADSRIDVSSANASARQEGNGGSGGGGGNAAHSGANDRDARQQDGGRRQNGQGAEGRAGESEAVRPRNAGVSNYI